MRKGFKVEKRQGVKGLKDLKDGIYLFAVCIEFHS